MLDSIRYVSKRGPRAGGDLRVCIYMSKAYLKIVSIVSTGNRSIKYWSQFKKYSRGENDNKRNKNTDVVAYINSYQYILTYSKPISIMSLLGIDLTNRDQHTRDKWWIHGPKQRKQSQ